jgi:hypothetical protein
MLSIRGGRSLKPFAAIAASVVMAIAIPMTSAFADDHEGSHSKAPKAPTAPKVLTTLAVNQQLCDAAKLKLTTDLTNDKPEDIQEHLDQQLDNETTEAAQAAADKIVDQGERALLAADRAAIETNCEPQPVTTSLCPGAQAALKSFLTGDKNEDTTERQTTETPDSGPDSTLNKTEDQSENAHLKMLRMAVETNCGSAEHGD